MQAPLPLSHVIQGPITSGCLHQSRSARYVCQYLQGDTLSNWSKLKGVHILPLLPRMGQSQALNVC